VLSRRLSKLLLYLAISLALVIFGLRATAIRWWRVPLDDPYLQASIAPTLAGGDLIVLWRMSRPRFGDLVLCPEPKAEDRVVIGRLVGVGGDKVRVQGNQLTVNGRSMHNGSACSEQSFTVTDPVTRREVEQRCDDEDLSGRVHKRGNAPPERAADPITFDAETDQGILISDNRLFPYDSRDFGPVKLTTCKETVVFRLVSAKGFSDVATRLSIIW
jgi:signal peptidase I